MPVEMLIISVLGAGLLVTTVAGRYLICRFATKAVATPDTSARIYLRQGAAIYKTHLIEARAKGLWCISAPRVKGDVIPLRPAERFIAEYTTSNGVALFETKIVGRCFNGRSLLITVPPRVTVRNRRETPRYNVRRVIDVNGVIGAVVNISEGGAKLRLPVPILRGSDVWLALEEQADIAAVVLDCSPEFSDVGRYSARVRFVQPFDKVERYATCV